MNIMNIHIDEKLEGRDISQLKQILTTVPHVINVELNEFVPHDLMIEYEEHHNVPITILGKLHKQGLHSDIQSC